MDESLSRLFFWTCLGLGSLGPFSRDCAKDDACSSILLLFLSSHLLPSQTRSWPFSSFSLAKHLENKPPRSGNMPKRPALLFELIIFGEFLGTGEPRSDIFWPTMPSTGDDLLLGVLWCLVGRASVVEGISNTRYSLSLFWPRLLSGC